MPKKFSLTLPDQVATALARLAKAEGNRPTTLATYYVEERVRTLMEEGKVPPEEPDVVEPPPPSNGELSEGLSRETLALLGKLVDGRDLCTSEEQLLAEACRRPPHRIHMASRKIQRRTHGD